MGSGPVVITEIRIQGFFRCRALKITKWFKQSLRMLTSKFSTVSSNQRGVGTSGRSYRASISLRDDDYGIRKNRAANRIDESEHVRNRTSQGLLSKPSAHLFC